MPKVATNNFPRTTHDIPVFSRLQTQPHGYVCPFYCQLVYPNSTIHVQKNTAAVRMDNSFVVPLDAIDVDISWFMVPIRFIDPDFQKFMGDKSTLDKNTYHPPFIKFYTGSVTIEEQDVIDLTLGQNPIFDYLGWKATGKGSNEYVPEKLNAWSFLAYWKVIDDWYRSELLEPEYFERAYSLVNNDTAHYLWSDNSLLQPYLSNKSHDYFTDAFPTPLREDVPTISVDGVSNVLLGRDVTYGSNVPIMAGYPNQSGLGTDLISQGTPILAELTDAGFTIDSLKLATAITDIAYSKQIFGTRFIEILNSQWGVNASDYLLGRSMYLKGYHQTLNNMPVLNTATDLGQMAGISATSLNNLEFTNSTEEWCILIALSTTRVAHHTYSQGLDVSLFGIENDLDMFNPALANIGFMPIENREIYNDVTDPENREPFGYAPAWQYMRQRPSTVAGAFAPMFHESGRLSDYTDFLTRWTYQDIYESRPYLSDLWLKEDRNNVQRTLTGQLIPHSGDADGFHIYPQYIFKYYIKMTETNTLGEVINPAETFSGRVGA